MSTSYRANNATLADAAEAGWTMQESSSGSLGLTDGRNWAFDVHEAEIDGIPVLWFERYGRSDVSDLVEALGAISEYEDGFWDGIDEDEDDEVLNSPEQPETDRDLPEDGTDAFYRS